MLIWRPLPSAEAANPLPNAMSSLPPHTHRTLHIALLCPVRLPVLRPCMESAYSSMLCKNVPGRPGRSSGAPIALERTLSRRTCDGGSAQRGARARTASRRARTCEATCAARTELVRRTYGVRATHVWSTCDASGAYARARRGADAPWPLGWTRPLGQPTLPTLLVLRDFVTRRGDGEVSNATVTRGF